MKYKDFGRKVIERNLESQERLFLTLIDKMADFDAIYQDQAVEEGASILEDNLTTFVPDPIVVRGAGNITV